MKKITIKIPSWAIVIGAIILIILTIGLTTTFIRASGRFNLPLSWILSPSGVLVDLDNNGIVDYVDAGIPSGLIALFDTSYPSGWTRVSGLDGKFLTGGASYNAAAGGSDSIALIEANLPSHSHGAGTLSADSAGAHTHRIVTHNTTGDIGVRSANAIGSWKSNYIESAGAHTHTISGSTGATGSGTAFDNRPAFATIVICKKD